MSTKTSRVLQTFTGPMLPSHVSPLETFKTGGLPAIVGDPGAVAQVAQTMAQSAVLADQHSRILAAVGRSSCCDHAPGVSAQGTLTGRSSRGWPTSTLQSPRRSNSAEPGRPRSQHALSFDSQTLKYRMLRGYLL
jgi:hypothetical protein